MKVHGVTLDLYHQVNRYYFKDKFGSRYIVLEINDAGGLKLQCVSRINNAGVFSIRAESVRFKASLRGDVGIVRKQPARELNGGR